MYRNFWPFGKELDSNDFVNIMTEEIKQTKTDGKTDIFIGTDTAFLSFQTMHEVQETMVVLRTEHGNGQAIKFKTGDLLKFLNHFALDISVENNKLMEKINESSEN